MPLPPRSHQKSWAVLCVLVAGFAKWNGNPKIILPRLLHGNLFIAFFMAPTIHTRMTRAKKYKVVTAIQT